MNMPSYRADARCLAGLAALVLVSLANVASAQGVVKCVDGDGNVTYQDSACTGNQAGRELALPKAESRDEATAWEAAARDARVVPGMPKRWVLRARGTPVEIRAGTPRDNATEVWRYAPREGVALLVGFAGSNVAWQRDEPAGRDTAPPGPAADPGARGAQNRRFVIAGRYCEHVFAEIGNADRQEPLPAPMGGVRYFYEPHSTDAKMRTTFSCIGGKVVDVERIALP